MKQIIRIIFYVVTCIVSVTGCSKDETEDVPGNGVLIMVEAPRTDGWSTEKIAGARNHGTNIVRQEGEDGLDMEADLRPDYEEAAVNKATTRWANIEGNTTFRVVAYRCSAASGISIANYAGYGDYKLLANNTVQTTPRSLTLPPGTYTFICYSYGNSSDMPAFSSSSTSVSASNGQNFMTCVKPGVTINNAGSTYTLGNIVFKHHCARYRILAKAQVGRMGNITACTGTLLLPKSNATYNFTNNSFSTRISSGTLNVAWSNPNGMNVYSNYVYLIPQSSAEIAIVLKLTIGGKTFENKGVTLFGLTFTSGKTYRSDISFTTTLGYIVGGTIWAGGNLFFTGSEFLFYNNTWDNNTAQRINEYWRWDALYPNAEFGNSATTWNPTRDPCRRVLGSWRLPTVLEFNSLLQEETTYTTKNHKTGLLIDNIFFLPCTGYYGASDINLSDPHRGLYWTSEKANNYYGMSLSFSADTADVHDSNFPVHQFAIRCVRAD